MFELLQKRISIIFDSQINTFIRIRPHGSISKSNIIENWERFVDLRARIINYLISNKSEALNDQVMQAFFSSIRILYKYNSKLAISYYKRIFPYNFFQKCHLIIVDFMFYFLKYLALLLQKKIKLFINKLNFK